MEKEAVTLRGHVAKADQKPSATYKGQLRRKAEKESIKNTTEHYYRRMRRGRTVICRIGTGWYGGRGSRWCPFSWPDAWGRPLDLLVFGSTGDLFVLFL